MNAELYKLRLGKPSLSRHPVLLALLGKQRQSYVNISLSATDVANRNTGDALMKINYAV